MANISKNSGLMSALGLAGELGYTIAIPIVVLALGGRLLDRKFGTSPWLLLIGIFISIVMSSWAIARKAKRIIQSQTDKES